jgi:hypothetical protein
LRDDNTTPCWLFENLAKRQVAVRFTRSWTLSGSWCTGLTAATRTATTRLGCLRTQCTTTSRATFGRRTPFRGGWPPGGRAHLPCPESPCWSRTRPEPEARPMAAISLSLRLEPLLDRATSESAWGTPGHSQKLQGVAHDSSHWCMTNRPKLWKIPVHRDLGAPESNLRGAGRRRNPFSRSAEEASTASVVPHVVGPALGRGVGRPHDPVLQDVLTCAGPRPSCRLYA